MPNTEKTVTPAPKTPIGLVAARFEAIGKDLEGRAKLATAEAKSAWDRAHLERLRDELATAREEARVQIHLASLETRDAFRKAEKRMDEVRHEASLAVDHVVADLGKQVQHFIDALRADDGVDEDES